MGLELPGNTPPQIKLSYFETPLTVIFLKSKTTLKLFTYYSIKREITTCRRLSKKKIRLGSPFGGVEL